MTNCNDHRRPTVRRGLTLVEILVVVGISVLVVGTLIMLLNNFRRGYQSGEEAAVSLQDAALFASMLRKDLINAVIPPGSPPDKWTEAITTAGDQLSMTVFVDVDGNTDRITYELDRGKEGNSIMRRTGKGGAKKLADDTVASLTWKVHAVSLTGKANGVRQVWVELSALFQKPRKLGGKGKPILLETRLFPVRLNKQLN